jgi:dihydrofolate synthase/folylpolyglutamate synthase
LYGLRGPAIKMGLEPTRRFLQHLNLYPLPYKTIHIAGTNGKGSVAIALHGILQAHGYRCGLYTSPHLQRFNERIRFNNIEIPDDFIATFLYTHKKYIEANETTFFETTTTMAFAWFATLNPDAVVVETGLGGRLDATNVVDPELVVITRIDIDHQNLLGNTLTEIAREKLGIAKRNKRIITTQQMPEVQKQINVHAKENQNRVTIAVPEHNISTPNEFTLHGKTWFYRYGNNALIHNLAMAIVASEQYLQSTFDARLTQDVMGLLQFPGRLECIRQNPLIYLDSSHNSSGIRHMLQTLKTRHPAQQWIGIMGLMKDKNIADVLAEMAGFFETIYTVTIEGERGMTKEALSTILKSGGINATPLPESWQNQLIEKMPKNGALVGFGSHFLLSGLKESVMG